LVFHDGYDLPFFASYPLLDEARGRAALRAYFATYVGLAREHRLPIVLETPTWRANPDWGARLGHGPAHLDRIHRDAVALLCEVRAAAPDVELVISGNLGPRGDGYLAGEKMTPGEAADYHGPQVRTFADTEADLVTLLTGTYTEEVIGVIDAARDANMPVVASFTVETDGRLPSGQPLADAVRQVDQATGAYAVSLGINCAHPDHFHAVLESGEDWVSRIGLLRANASRMSHAELDAAETLDDGDPAELAESYATLRRAFPSLRVVGGCCGTDHRHVGAIASVA
ncbi:MAG: homocysteine S-methyltransferase family protein, partial [Myxococcota bacterium]